MRGGEVDDDAPTHLESINDWTVEAAVAMAAWRWGEELDNKCRKTRNMGERQGGPRMREVMSQ